MSRKKLWRPALFSALGAGFKSDDTVHDGIHLRWNFDSRLGLPYQKSDTKKGNFKVYAMAQNEKSINNVDLFEANTKAFLINSANLFNLNHNAQTTLLPIDNKVYFIKNTQQDHVALDWHYNNLSNYIKALAFYRPKRDNRFFKYMNNVMKAFSPFYVPTKPEWEIGEVCAIDIAFSRKPVKDNATTPVRQLFTMQQFNSMNKANATKLAGDLSKFANITNHNVIKNVVSNYSIDKLSSIKSTTVKPLTLIKPKITDVNLTSSILSHVNPNIITLRYKNDVYARVKAWNSNDQVIDEDWIGTYAKKPLVFNSPFGNTSSSNAGKLKTKVKLRAVGIEYITLEFVKNKPLLYPTTFKYVFCEDYCRSIKLWKTTKELEENIFNANSEYHSESIVKSKHYAPFKKGFDWSNLSNSLKKHFINDPHVNAMLNESDTYKTYMYRAKYDAPDVDLESKDSVNLPLLPALMSASIDPAFANILGLYKFIKDLDYDGRDFKIEADFPFFTKENIEKMDKNLGDLISNNSSSVLKELQTVLHDIKLCGLILAPRITKKPSPPITSPLNSKITCIDLPNQENANAYDLFGDAEIKIPFKALDIKPYQKIIAVALEKSTNKSNFKNVIDSDEKTVSALDGFSILPGVYLPKTEEGRLINPMEINDYFSLPSSNDNLVQYQGIGFDIFGRPSNTSLGAEHELQLPCKPPQQPANISGQIVTNGDNLLFEINFSLFDGKLPLIAAKDMVELWIHELPMSNNTPERTQWTGNKASKKIMINYDSQGQILNLNTLASTCSNLKWTANKLQRTNTSTAVCNTTFSNATPSVSEIHTASFDHQETGFLTYRLTWKVANKSSLSPGTHQWACRIRVKGLCPKSGETLFSNEPVVAASTNITPPPPPVLQPIIAEIPESTFADNKGHAYFSVDLNDFIPPGDRAAAPLVKLYKLTLDKLYPNIETIVNEDTLLDQTDFLNQAKRSKLPFKLITTDPIRYNEENRFVEVQIPGELETYHVLGVIGCNPFLEEEPWTQSGIIIFKTPKPLQIPELKFVFSDPFTTSGNSQIALQYSIKFINNILISQPPKIQLFRKNKTLGDNQNTFIDIILGELIPSENPSEYIYNFNYLDENLTGQNRYVYEAHLLVFSPKHGHYIKSDLPASCKIISKMEKIPDLAGKIDEPLIQIVDEKMEVTFEFDSGEFDFSLTKVSVNGTRHRYTGKIRNSTLFFDHFEAVLEGTNRFTLIFKDPDISKGTYTIRLSYGQLFTWTKKIETTT